ncbi:MAG: hypothetical protein ACI8XB_001749 [Patiriisocius sp.]|jgi:hypothetical protein
MKVNYSREELLRVAAEKMRQKREKEEREDNEFYKRITSGTPWLIFKGVVVFCTLLVMVTTIEFFVDGPTKKLTEEDWRIDRNWEWTWHQIVDVEGYLFAPQLGDWLDHVDNSLEITYSPILRTGKKLSYDIQVGESGKRSHEEIRFRSIFAWFPAVQLFLLIPLVTFLFKRQRPWFNFTRVASLFFVFPGALLVIYFSML